MIYLINDNIDLILYTMMVGHCPGLGVQPPSASLSGGLKAKAPFSLFRAERRRLAYSQKKGTKDSLSLWWHLRIFPKLRAGASGPAATDGQARMGCRA